MDVKDVLEGVGGIGLDVGAECLAGGLVEVVVLFDEVFELCLDLGDLVFGELVLVEGDAGGLEVGEEGELGGEEEDEGAAGGAHAGGAADAVDVVLGLVWGVVLDDPVDGGDVEAAGGDVGGEEDALFGVAELKEGGGALVLLLLAVELEDGDVDVVEELGVELDRGAGAEEDDDLLAEVLFEEGEEEAEAHVALGDDVALLERLDGGGAAVAVDVDKDGLGEREARDVLDLVGHGRAEEHRLARARQQAQDLVHLLLEALRHDAVRLVDHEQLQVLEHKAARVVQVVQQPPRRRHQQVHALAQLALLRLAARPANHHPVRLREEPHQLHHHLVQLQRQLPRRAQHNRPRPVPRHKLGPVQQLHRRDQERQRLAAPRRRLPQQVLPPHQRRQRRRLDPRQVREAHLPDAPPRRLRKTLKRLKRLRRQAAPFRSNFRFCFSRFFHFFFSHPFCCCFFFCFFCRFRCRLCCRCFFFLLLFNFFLFFFLPHTLLFRLFLFYIFR